MGVLGTMVWMVICGGVVGILYLTCKPVREFIRTGGYQND